MLRKTGDGEAASPLLWQGIARPAHAVAAGAVSVAVLGSLIYGATSPDAQIFCPSVYRGPGMRRSVALTFDDGPSKDTALLATFLDSRRICATFFQCGANVKRLPEITRALHQGGHQIGNHTFSHRRLCPRVGWRMNLRTPRDVFHEFALTQEIIESATGQAPCLMRAPYGLRWAGMGAAHRRLGLLGVHWTIITQDWIWNAEQIVAHVLRHVSPGAILCFHDGRDTLPNPDISQTLRAVQRLVPLLESLGYTFETVSEILQP